MSTIKRFVICSLSVLIVGIFSIFPAFASNSDYTFEFNIPEPLANEYSGYIIQPWIHKTTNEATCYIYYWTITPINSTDLTTIPSVSYTYNLSTNSATLLCGTGANSGSWYFSLWVASARNSNVRHVVSDVISYDSSASFTIRPSQNASSQYWTLTPKFKGLTIADTLPTGRTETYDVLFSSDSTIYNELLEIENHFVSMLAKQDLTNENLAEIIAQFNELIETAYNIDYSLSEFVFQYWYQFQNFEFPQTMSRIEDVLKRIFQALNAKGDVEQTTVDSSNVDEYLDIEQSLVDNPDAESALNEFDISIDGQAYSFIWEFITNCFNSHPEVFGLVITILTLGIIALILNR